MKKAVLKLSNTPTSTPLKLGAVYRVYGSDDFYILAAADSSLYSLISLSDGWRWGDPLDEIRMQKELDEKFQLVAGCIEIDF